MAQRRIIPPEPLATPLMDWAFTLRMNMGRKLMYNPARMIVQVSPWTLIKGPCQEQELEALLFVAEHTSILCPKVHRTYRRRDGLFIEMDYVRGTDLESAWDSGLPESTRKQIGVTIRSYVEQLRALEPPEDFAIGSAAGGPVKDGRISTSSHPPFKTTSDFISFLRGSLSASERIDLEREQSGAQQTYRGYFTHADICPRNFILQDDGRLVLIDWEFSGWWPEYWEYTKCHFAIFKDHVGWLDLIEKAVPPYMAELQGERFLWDHRGDSDPPLQDDES